MQDPHLTDTPELPAMYTGPDEASAAAQAAVIRALKVSLVGMVIAASFGAFSITRGSIDYAGLVASVGFLAALACSAWITWAKPDRRWYDARAAAESVKTLAWQFAVAGGEFARDDDESEAQSRLLARMRDMLADLRGIAGMPATDAPQITDWMRRTRAAPLDDRRTVYLTHRIHDQCEWYASKAKWNAARRDRWNVATIALQTLGLGGGIAKAFFGLDVDILGIAAAGAGAATAWARSKDYAQLAEAYAVTAQELRILADGADLVTDEASWAEFVDDAERAFSREHTLWKARRGHSLLDPLV